MANPQVENGHTRTANELEEQFYRRAFTAREHAILGWVRRQTYGYKRKLAPFTTRAIADATELDISHVRKAIEALTAAEVLTIHEGEIGIQKDHDRWKILPRKEAKSALQKRPNRPSEEGQNGLPKEAKLASQKGPKRPPSKAKLASFEPENTCDDAVSQEAKENSKAIKASMAMPSAPVSFLDGIEWGDGEADFWLKVFGYSKPGDLALMQGGTLAQFKALMAFSTEARAKAIAYLKAVVAGGKAINKPLPYVLGYLQDPTKYPTLEAPKVIDMAEAKAIAEAKRDDGNPYAGKPWAHRFAPRMRGTATDDHMIRTEAGRVEHQFGRQAIDFWHAVSLLESDGVVGAMDYVFACEQKARKNASPTAL